MEAQCYPYLPGEEINRNPNEVLIRDDLQTFLQQTYVEQPINLNEMVGIISSCAEAELSETELRIIQLPIGDYA